ncbi:DUF2071 domain-containing protein [Streptomyces achromogenes]|uniref:DUF2071 domain-containing protein n=1 Tax=Streptomyces achromogenes TaxID=67255 RepID=UPI0022853377|nr:DUF2071 domain-containing protein [Streptomyces sp. UMAF16]
MAAYGAEHRVRLPALCAGWMTQTFVHWAYPAEAVRALVPQPLVVEEYGGSAWVGFTPFVMTDVRPPGVPSALPGLPTFAETNLRTYVRHPNGRDGLWFFSLEVACPLMLGARAIGAPYHPGVLEVTRSGETVRYSGRRRRGRACYRLAVRPGAPVERPTARDVWLTSRWRAYTRSPGLLWETPVAHEPWPLAGAAVEELEETLTAEAGLPAPAGEPVVHFSDGVRHVRMGVPVPCSRTP